MNMFAKTTKYFLLIQQLSGSQALAQQDSLIQS